MKISWQMNVEAGLLETLRNVLDALSNTKNVPAPVWAFTVISL